MSGAEDDTAAPGSTDPPGIGAPLSVDDVEAAAVRSRIAERMFGAAPNVVRIGRYEIADRIGAGGMGVVYSARDPELGRLVALKVLSPRRSEDLRHRQRLLSEARALARLSHPNVVQIHEVGVHEGAVFLALELVEGETLQAWQRRPGRRWQEILGAYVDAAQGLAAAHGVGVVHRDVKPSNILVGVDGRVRVVDFGLAREVEGATTGATSEHTDDNKPSADATGTGAVMGTPGYMSPEQAAGRPADARSDQFSLCVSLFEGLHGERPFEARALRRLTARDVAALRRLVPPATPVPGWLREILARGLQPDPARRFPDVGALITALRETPRRLARRRRLGGSVVALGLAGWAAVELRPPAIVCPELSETLPGSWDSSTKPAIRGRFVASGLPFATTAWEQVERSFDAAALDWSRERRASCVATWVEHSQSQEQFDLGTACLATHERELRELALRLQTGVDSRLVIRAHELLRELGDPGLCNQTEHLRGGPPPPASASVRAAVESLRERLGELRVLTITADFDRAHALADELLAAAAIHEPLRAEVLYRKAIVLHRSGDLAGAQALLDEAEELAEAVRDDRLAAAIHGQQTELAVLGTRDVARARIHARLYGAKLRRIDGDAAARADYHDRLGELELLDGQYAAALARHEEASRLRPAEDSLGRARSARGAANALAELGRVDEALGRLLAARDLIAAELGASHPDVAVIDMDVGLALYDRGEFVRARDVLREAVANEARSLGPDDVGTARTRSALAMVSLELGDIGVALVEAERSHAALSHALPPTHDDVTTALALLENIHRQRRDWGAAAAIASVRIQALGDAGQPIPADSHLNMGEYLYNLGRAAEAIPHYDQALALLSAEPDADVELLLHTLNGRAKVHLALDQPALARVLYERALERLPDTRHLELRAELLSGMAQSLWLTGGRRDEARRLAREALALFGSIEGTEPAAALLRARLKIE